MLAAAQKFTNRMKKIKKAIFPVARRVSKSLPATKAMPREMLTLGGKPLIQHAYEEALEAGIEEFIFITNKDKSQSTFAGSRRQENKPDLLTTLKASKIPEGKLFVEYQEKPMGLGHAIWCARDFVGNEPFAVILPDDIILNKTGRPKTGCLRQLIEAYNKIGGNIVATAEVAAQDTSRYGILDIGSARGNLIEIASLIEKPAPLDAPSLFSIVGRYILQPDIFDILGKSTKSYGREIRLTDAMSQLIGKQSFHGLKVEGRRLDCGSHIGYSEATAAYALDNGNTAQQARENY